VTVGYDGRAALTDVSVTVDAGTILAVFGPNGGGKSTFLKVVAGLLKPWSGRVQVLGAAPGGEARRIAYVPQAEQVDWEFPVSSGTWFVMGRYARSARSGGRAPRTNRSGGRPRWISSDDTQRADPDRPPVRRAASEGVPGPGACSRPGPVPCWTSP